MHHGEATTLSSVPSRAAGQPAARRAMLTRLTAGLRILRPRTIMQMRKAVADSRHEIVDLTQTVAALTRGIQQLEQTIRTQQAEIAAIRTSEAQLRAIAEHNLAFEGRQAALAGILHTESIRTHVEDVIARAVLRTDPFPHMVIDRLLPDTFYDALIAGLPPSALFADRPPNKRSLLVPFHLAPDFSHRVWQFMADVVVRDVLTPALAARFAEPLDDWMQRNFAAATGTPPPVSLVSSDGRILLRTRGYRIRPHRDPKWGFLTAILYLARPGDDQRWGTDLYAVEGDQEACGAAPHWIDESRCRPASTVSFKRNRVLVFLNSLGAHGAAIPADAQPANLERFIYQFRIGPDAASMAALSAALPPERQALWAGKQRTY